MLLSSCQESGTLRGHTLSVKHCASRNNAQYKVLEVTKAPLSQCPALPQDFLRLSEPPPHHVRSLLLPCRMKPPTPPHLICYPHLVTGDCFLNCRTVSKRGHLESQTVTPCAPRGLSRGEFCLKSLQVKQQWSRKTAP